MSLENEQSKPKRQPRAHDPETGTWWHQAASQANVTSEPRPQSTLPGIGRPEKPKAQGRCDLRSAVLTVFSLMFQYCRGHLEVLGDFPERLLRGPVFSLETCCRDNPWSLKDLHSLPGAGLQLGSDSQARDHISQPASHLGGLNRTSPALRPSSQLCPLQLPAQLSQSPALLFRSAHP